MRYEIGGVSLDLTKVADDVRDDVFAAIKGAHEAAVTGLENKRTELLAKVKDLQSQVRNGSDGNIGELYAKNSELQDQISELKGTLAGAQHEAEQHAKRADAAEASATDWQGKHNGLVVNNGLTAALMEVGVKNPALLDGSRALLTDKVKLADDGELSIGDKPISEALKEWSESDAGKAFVDAGSNAGGSAGSNTSGNPSGFEGPNPFAKETRNLTKQIEIQNSNPELAKTLQESAA